MYVVTGVSGHTGAVVANTLLAQKKSVRVIVRDANKATSWRTKGADVCVADFEDTNAFSNAIKGAEGLYLLIPPAAYGASQILENRRKITDAMTTAMANSGVKHIAFLSSIGAQHAEGTGIVKSLYYAEQKINSLKIPTTFIRAAYFMENWGAMFQSAQQTGTLYTFLSPADRAIPMVATHDIGTTAAKALLEPVTTQNRIFNLCSGPTDYSPNDVAATLSKIWGKTIQVQVNPEAAMPATLQSFGFSDDWANLMTELTSGINRGHVAWATTSTIQTRGSTTLEQTFRNMMSN